MDNFAKRICRELEVSEFYYVTRQSENLGFSKKKNIQTQVAIGEKRPSEKVIKGFLGNSF